MQKSEKNFIPNDYESEMSPIFLENKNIWLPVLQALNSSINDDNDQFNKVRLDSKVIPLVLALRLHGFPTSMSCQGHVSRAYTNFAEDTEPYVNIDEKPIMDLYPDEILFLNSMIPEVINNLRSKGKLIGDSAFDQSKEIVSRKQITIPVLGYYLYVQISDIFMTWEALKTRKRSKESHQQQLTQYININRLAELIDSFIVETPNTKKIYPKIVKFTDNLHVLKFHKHEGSGFGLEQQQEIMQQFGDYLFARYLVEHHNVIATYNT